MAVNGMVLNGRHVSFDSRVYIQFATCIHGTVSAADVNKEASIKEPYELDESLRIASVHDCLPSPSLAQHAAEHWQKA